MLIDNNVLLILIQDVIIVYYKKKSLLLCLTHLEMSKLSKKPIDSHLSLTRALMNKGLNWILLTYTHYFITQWVDYNIISILRCYYYYTYVAVLVMNKFFYVTRHIIEHVSNCRFTTFAFGSSVIYLHFDAFFIYHFIWNYDAWYFSIKISIKNRFLFKQ